MFVLGLTGSIGMGKTAAAAMLRRLGVPVHEADAVVYRLLGAGGAAVAPVADAFPSVLVDGAIDRTRLGGIVFADAAKLRRLEAILHPMVGASATAFLRRHARWRSPLVALDIPLLFETGGAARVDAVLVVTTSALVQTQRVLRRPGMTRARLAAILARQVPDAEKRRRADYVVVTGLGKHYTLRVLSRSVRSLRGRRGLVASSVGHARSRSRY